MFNELEKQNSIKLVFPPAPPNFSVALQRLKQHQKEKRFFKIPLDQKGVPRGLKSGRPPWYKS